MPSDFPDIAPRVARLLSTTEATIGEDPLDDSILLRVTVLLTDYPCLGDAYEDIVDPDKVLFDWGVAYLVASDIWEWVRRLGGGTDTSGATVSKRKQGSLEVSYSTSTSTTNQNRSGGNLAQDYWEKGWEILSRLDCIGDETPLSSTEIKFVQPLSTLSPLAPVDCEDWARQRGWIE